MIQIRYSLISLHWRKKHIIGLIVVTISILCAQFFLSSISLGEGYYVNDQFCKTIIEIIGLAFILYFGSNTRNSFLQSKIFYLFRSKSENAGGIIGGMIAALISIVILYVSISYMFASYTGGISGHYFHSRLGTIIVLSVMTLITIGLSLISNSYITFMGGTIFYFISYSINFIITSIQNQANGKVINSLLHIIQAILPRFDLLTSPLIPLKNWELAIIGHSILALILYYIIIRIFSSRYMHYENLFYFGHSAKKK